MTRPPNPRTPRCPGWKNTVSVQTSVMRAGVCGLGEGADQLIASLRSQVAQPESPNRYNRTDEPNQAKEADLFLPLGGKGRFSWIVRVADMKSDSPPVDNAVF